MSNEKQFNAPALVEEYGVRQLKAEYIVQGYREVIDPARIPEWEGAASGIEVTSEEQREDMAAARELRLQIRQSRLAVENTRKDLKDDALRESKAIDGLGRLIRERLEAVEEHLKAQEEFAQRAEEERQRLRREEADRLLREKEEREAREAEEARLAEQKRIQAENALLRQETAKLEKQREKERQERAEHEARIEAEREQERKKAREREKRQRAAYEANLRKAREETERLAATVVCPHCGTEFDSRGRHPEEA